MDAKIQFPATGAYNEKKVVFFGSFLQRYKPEKYEA